MGALQALHLKPPTGFLQPPKIKGGGIHFRFCTLLSFFSISYEYEKKIMNGFNLLQEITYFLIMICFELGSS